MKLFHAFLVSFLSLTSSALAATSWSFEDGSLTIQGKGSGVGGGVKEKYVTVISITHEQTADE